MMNPEDDTTNPIGSAATDTSDTAAASALLAASAAMVSAPIVPDSTPVADSVPPLAAPAAPPVTPAAPIAPVAPAEAAADAFTPAVSLPPPVAGLPVTAEASAPAAESASAPVTAPTTPPTTDGVPAAPVAPAVPDTAVAATAFLSAAPVAPTPAIPAPAPTAPAPSDVAPAAPAPSDVAPAAPAPSDVAPAAPAPSEVAPAAPAPTAPSDAAPAAPAPTAPSASAATSTDASSTPVAAATSAPVDAAAAVAPVDAASAAAPEDASATAPSAAAVDVTATAPAAVSVPPAQSAPAAPSDPAPDAQPKLKRKTAAKKAGGTSTGIKKKTGYRGKKGVAKGDGVAKKTKGAGRGRRKSSTTKAAKQPKKKKGSVVYNDKDDKDNNFYEIEKIVGAKRDEKDGVVYYKVRWKGYAASDDTWEPSTNLCDTAFQDAIKGFHLEKSYGKLFKKQQAKQKQKKNNKLMKQLLEDDDDPSSSVVQEEEGDGATAAKKVGRKKKVVDDDEDYEMSDVDMEDDHYLEGDSSPGRKRRKTSSSVKSPSSSSKKQIGEDPWSWTDDEQIKYREVERIHVHNDVNVQQRITDARLNGTPVVLVGHVGWPHFAKRWLREKTPPVTKETKDANTTTTAAQAPPQQRKRVASKQVGGKISPKTASNLNSNEWLDLSNDDLELDIDKMINDIGEESVPVLKPNYNEQNPIQGEIPAATFLKRFWPSKEYTKKQILKKLYLHQWQFPLSQTAAKLLCSDVPHNMKLPSDVEGGDDQEPCCNPLPDHVMGIDLLKYWLDPDKCNKDSPYQYLFMGTKDTVSRLHNDKGGMDITIAPIVGTKEVLLVHRSDALNCLYHLNAKLRFDTKRDKTDNIKVDLHKYPLMYHTRIWKTKLHPGEILLMPYNTYHQTRNITPCLSYSRFYLDHINLKPFLDSLLINDAPEIIHHEIIWNSTTELRDQLNEYLAEYKTKPVKLSNHITNLINTLRVMRNICRELTRRLYIEQKNNSATAGGSASNSLLRQSIPNDGDRDPKIWDQLITEIDMAIHEFRYRQNYHDSGRKIPQFKKRKSTFEDIMNTNKTTTGGEGGEGDAEEGSNNGQPTGDNAASALSSDKYSYRSNSAANDKALKRLHLKDAFEFYLPNLTPIQELSNNIADKNLAELTAGSKVTIKLLGKLITGCTIQEVCENMTAAYVQYIDDGTHYFDHTNTTENYSNEFYNEFQPMSKLRLPSISDGDGAVNHTEIPSLADLLADQKKNGNENGLVVINYWGTQNEEYRAVVQSWKIGTFYRISFQFGGSDSIPGQQPLQPYTIERWLTRDYILDGQETINKPSFSKAKSEAATAAETVNTTSNGASEVTTTPIATTSEVAADVKDTSSAIDSTQITSVAPTAEGSAQPESTSIATTELPATAPIETPKATESIATPADTTVASTDDVQMTEVKDTVPVTTQMSTTASANDVEMPEATETVPAALLEASDPVQEVDTTPAPTVVPNAVPTATTTTAESEGIANEVGATTSHVTLQTAPELIMNEVSATTTEAQPIPIAPPPVPTDGVSDAPLQPQEGQSQQQ